jgi:hypothetical protein
MLFKITADLVIVIHFLWIVFIIVGFPIFLYFNLTVWRLIHLTVLVVTIIMQVTRTICPLTYLEAYLKSKDSVRSVYPGSFIIGKIEDLIYVQDITLEIISYLTLLFFLIVLFSFWFRPIKRNEKS